MGLKAIIIDVNALFNIQRVLGYFFELKNFRSLLVDIIGESMDIWDGRPIVVCRKDKLTANQYWRNFGFSVMPADSSTSQADDDKINQLINEMTVDVTEIVLVGADKHYAEALEQKLRDGVKVYLVATAKIDEQCGSRMISDHMLSMFNFVELYAHKQYLYHKDFIEKRATIEDIPLATLEITFKCLKMMNQAGAAMLIVARNFGVQHPFTMQSFSDDEWIVVEIAYNSLPLTIVRDLYPAYVKEFAGKYLCKFQLIIHENKTAADQAPKVQTAAEVAGDDQQEGVLVGVAAPSSAEPSANNTSSLY